jgi:aryl-alcohol dehydrogenase-like predicted oxidoreductase
MERRELGTSGLEVSAIGLGCMGMSQSYGAGDDDESIRTILRAIDLGLTLLDTADAYGKGANELLVGRGIRERRGGVVVATKFGLVPNPSGGTATDVDARPERVKPRARPACAAWEATSICTISIVSIRQCP